MRAILLQLPVAFVLAQTALTESLPANVVVVPAAQAQCLALHPRQPVLYAGVAPGGARGLATFRLDTNGKPVANSRQDFADGLVEALPVPSGAEYSVGSIAVNPRHPQIYLSAQPRRFSTYRANTAALDVVAIDLADTGFPEEKVASLRSEWRISPVHQLACDPQGRYVYLGELHGGLGAWPVGDDPPEPRLKLHTGKHPPRNRQPERKRSTRSLFTPPMPLTSWIYVPEWKRYYGGNKDALRVILTISDDGLSCTFAQPIAMLRRHQITPVVSVKHRKMYIASGQEAQLGIYQLTHEGRLTSVPRFMPLEPARFTAVDDKNGLFYLITPGGELAIYTLDLAGNPAPRPRRFALNAGAVNDALLSPTGVLYLACAKPAEEKP